MAQTDSTLYIDGAQGRLYTCITLPDGDAGCPMVILSHGFGSDMNSPIIASLARELPARGIGVVRFDFNGCGKSDGEFQNMTVPNEIEDLLAVIAWTRLQPRTESISLVGHSQGGVVSGMAAGTCGDKQIKCLGLLSAAAVLREDALRGNTQGAKYDPWHLDQAYYIIPGRNLKLGRAYIQTAMTLP
ncbi:MAG: alpha/beta fold hydrolase, partial [Duncaniella sp.]|nr:alpha/beta fold hydrolase [Duncaniella sp.]